MLDLSEIVSDEDLAQPFQIMRSSGGSFTAGVWNQTTSTIQSYGVISVAQPRDLLQLPEADRVTGMMVFHSYQPIFATSETRAATSDILVWRGQQFRVQTVFPFADYGYWKAFAVRIQGS